ncbi:hypothetical protein [Thalassobacillus pellis]|uniref:hypothetical protein n=1 Tax=Thalassobacillus pellis TaxID=748008 RepID=UPI001EF96A6B|nr:hypothetical protein [Thalassobacillus pellis]MBM7551633.1 hypothetical protein [Thalassobacillus pellis]
MKKIGMSIVAFAFAMTIPFSSAEASGNGIWDFVGAGGLWYNSSYGFYNTWAHNSWGGDFMIKTGSDTPNAKYKLWESDPGSNNDDYVGAVFLAPGDEYPFRNINRFVDGSNNQAEFYVTANNGGEITFYD